jgi:hypothetical protein
MTERWLWVAGWAARVAASAEKAEMEGRGSLVNAEDLMSLRDQLHLLRESLGPRELAVLDDGAARGRERSA